MKWYDWFFIFVMGGTAAIFYHFSGALSVSTFFWASLYVLLRECKKSSDDKLSNIEHKLIIIDVTTEMMHKPFIIQFNELHAQILTIKAMIQLQQIRDSQRDKPEGKIDEVR